VAATAVPVRRTISNERWFRFIVRVVLSIMALWALTFAQDHYAASQRITADVGGLGRYAEAWLAWISATISAGFLFGLATWLPFARVRYLWSRLLLAALAALAVAPLAQYWWVFGFQLPRHGEAGGWIYRWLPNWILDQTSQSALAVLAGVAIASGFRAAQRAGDEERP
jgi:hypothetical protein